MAPYQLSRALLVSGQAQQGFSFGLGLSEVILWLASAEAMEIIADIICLRSPLPEEKVDLHRLDLHRYGQN